MFVAYVFHDPEYVAPDLPNSLKSYNVEVRLPRILVSAYQRFV
jgi:hypothetical protein